MRLLITGDTHGEPLGRFKDILKETERSDEKPNFNKGNLMIVLGDFGVIWGEDTPKTHRIENSILDQIEAMPFTTLFIDGNHENFDRLMAFPEEKRYGGKIGVLRPSVLHLKQRGHVYNLNGVKAWCFGGGSSIDKTLRKEGRSWWTAEDPTEDEYTYGLKQLEKHYWETDIVLTHEGPFGAVLSLGLKPLSERDLGYKPYLYDPISPYLEMISRKLKFEHWFFGHYHQNMTDFSSSTSESAKHPGEDNYSSVFTRVVDIEIPDKELREK